MSGHHGVGAIEAAWERAHRSSTSFSDTARHAGTPYTAPSDLVPSFPSAIAAACGHTVLVVSCLAAFDSHGEVYHRAAAWADGQEEQHSEHVRDCARRSWCVALAHLSRSARVHHAVTVQLSRAMWAASQPYMPLIVSVCASHQGPENAWSATCAAPAVRALCSRSLCLAQPACTELLRS